MADLQTLPIEFIGQNLGLLEVRRHMRICDPALNGGGTPESPRDRESNQGQPGRVMRDERPEN
jgi:hypothetical protein